MGESKKKRIERFLTRRSDVGGPIVPLEGDASTRSFFRVRLGGGGAVMMVLEEPKGGDDLDYVNVRDHLAACGVNVPEIYDYDPAAGVLLLQDFGDESLERRFERADATEVRRYYRRAIDQLIIIHIAATSSRRDCVAFRRAFDQRKLMEELDFFITHTLEGHLRIYIEESDKEKIKEGFSLLAHEIAAFPRVFSHRDYHSRNLMVTDGDIRVLDFQDARMGPCQYDLASLLKDSYVRIDGALREELCDYYLFRSGEQGIEWYDREEFMRRFDLVSIQRNLKACGTFGYMASVRGHNSYARYIEPTLGYLKECVPRFPELADCFAILAGYVPYLR